MAASGSGEKQAVVPQSGATQVFLPQALVTFARAWPSPYRSMSRRLLWNEHNHPARSHLAAAISTLFNRRANYHVVVILGSNAT